MNQIITTNPDHHIPWNKGKLIGQKAPLKLKERDLGYTYSPAIGKKNKRTGFIQSSHRQQAARLRFGKAARV